MATAPSAAASSKPVAKARTKVPPTKHQVADEKTPAAMSAEEKRAARAAARAALAAAKKARAEGDLIEYQATKFVVPMWFGMHSVSQGLLKKNRSLPPEAALCLMFIGTRGPGGECEVGIQMRLRPSGFDRQEAALLAGMGTASLIGAKLAKRVKPKPGDNREAVLQNNVLTAKGQKLYELVKRSVLAPT